MLSYVCCVVDAPVILQQPLDQLSVTPGNSVSFYVLLSGLRLSYLWSGSGALLPSSSSSRIEGRNTSTLTIHAVVSSDIGMYQCLITNAAGSVNSSSAALDIGEFVVELYPVIE